MPDPGKTRSLKELNRVLSAFAPLESLVSDLLLTKPSVDVLEVGFGWGGALRELAWPFRHHQVTFYGVDAKQKPPVEKREDLRKIVIQFESIAPAALLHLGLRDNGQLSMPGERLPLRNQHGKIRMGFRVVCDIPEDLHSALFTRGLLMGKG